MARLWWVSKEEKEHDRSSDNVARSTRGVIEASILLLELFILREAQERVIGVW